MPLKNAIVTVDHVNPQAFSPSAPFADLAVRAEVKPAEPDKPGSLVVTGPVSIVNAKPGPIDEQAAPAHRRPRERAARRVGANHLAI